MSRLVCFTLAVLGSLSALAAEPTVAKTIPSLAVIATRCEAGFVYVQFKDQDEWFPTPRECDVSPKLNAVRSGATAEQVDPKTVDGSKGCAQGYVGVTFKTRGARCIRIVLAPPTTDPPVDGLFVVCPYPQRFSTCHGAGNWGCGSQDGVRGCWTQ
jgi:hypothetical protein